MMRRLLFFISFLERVFETILNPALMLTDFYRPTSGSFFYYIKKVPSKRIIIFLVLCYNDHVMADVDNARDVIT